MREGILAASQAIQLLVMMEPSREIVSHPLRDNVHRRDHLNGYKLAEKLQDFERGGGDVLLTLDRAIKELKTIREIYIGNGKAVAVQSAAIDYNLYRNVAYKFSDDLTRENDVDDGRFEATPSEAAVLSSTLFSPNDRRSA